MYPLKQKIFEVIQPAETGWTLSRIFDLSIILMIAVSVVSVFIATFDLPEDVRSVLAEIEMITVVIFSAEYLLRFWTANYLYPELSAWKARCKYVSSPSSLIDLLAILPFYLPFLLPINLLSLRSIRLLRLLRVFKMNRYTDELISVGEVFKKKYRQLVASFFLVSVLLIIASLLIYNVEHDVQPEKFENAFSGIWWAVATLTTVGYGDIYPITATGRIIAAIIAILGIGMVAIPTGILSSGFIEHLNEEQPDEKQSDEQDTPIQYCPHCGKKLK